MNKKYLSSVIVSISITVIASFALSCSSLDVVGKDSIRAFDELMKIVPPVEVDDKWIINAPDGGAQFLWNGSQVVFKIDARPFIAAGLDMSYPKINVIDGEPFIIINCCDPDFAKSDGNGEHSHGGKRAECAVAKGTKTTPLGDYENLVNTNRGLIQYHFERDHHAVVMGENMFKWAKDFDKLGKSGEEQRADMVFVLDPKPLIAAGVDPSVGVEGWRFDVFEMMGSVTDRFTKPFNLR